MKSIKNWAMIGIAILTLFMLANIIARENSVPAVQNQTIEDVVQIPISEQEIADRFVMQRFFLYDAGSNSKGRHVFVLYDTKNKTTRVFMHNTSFVLED